MTMFRLVKANGIFDAGGLNFEAFDIVNLETVKTEATLIMQDGDGIKPDTYSFSYEFVNIPFQSKLACFSAQLAILAKFLEQSDALDELSGVEGFDIEIKNKS